MRLPKLREENLGSMILRLTVDARLKSYICV